MEYFYLLTRSSFFIFRVLLCSPSFLTADLLSSIAPIIGITTLRYGNGLSLERRMSMDIIPNLSSSLYYLYFLRFINIITEFDSSFSPAAISFSLPFSSPFRLPRQGLKHLKHDRLQFLHLQIFGLLSQCNPVFIRKVIIIYGILKYCFSCLSYTKSLVGKPLPFSKLNFLSRVCIK